MKDAILHLGKDPILKATLHLDINIPYFDGEVNAYLYSSIISQQLSTIAADAIFTRFLNHFDGNSPTPEVLLACDYETLRSLGLSNAKTKYIRNVASYFLENPRPLEYWSTKTDAEVITELTSIKGVGEWTVQMVLIFCLARRDVFPILDLAVRNSAIELYQLEGEKKSVHKRLIKIAEEWRPYRSIASLYLWAWRNQGKN